VPGALCGLLPAHRTYLFPADDASTSTGHIGSLGLYSDCVGVEAHHVAEARTSGCSDPAPILGEAVKARAIQHFGATFEPHQNSLMIG
jgi:hypothetical protein